MNVTAPHTTPEPTQLSISLAEARRLLADTHKVAVGDEDPILMAVTLHQAFIADYMALLEEHRAALKRDVAEVVSASAKMIDDSAVKLRDDLLNTAVKNVIASVAEQAEKAGLIKLHMRSLLKSIAVLTGVSVLAAAIAIIALFAILK